MYGWVPLLVSPEAISNIVTGLYLNTNKSFKNLKEFSMYSNPDDDDDNDDNDITVYNRPIPMELFWGHI